MPARRILPSPPRTQSYLDTAFRPPPLDGSLTLPEIYEWHAKHNPNHRFFVFANDDDTIQSISFSEVVRAVHVGARIIRDRMGWKPDVDETPVVAILAASDVIPYCTTVISVMRAGYAVFPLSIRNSPTAVAHLIDKTQVKHILVGQEQAMHDLLDDALDILKSKYPSTPVPGSSPLLVFGELYNSSSDERAVTSNLPYEFKGSDAPAMILHSSGSTAFPKPITFTNNRVIELAASPWFGERNLTGYTFSLHSMPMFHAMGSMVSFWAVSCGFAISVFAPKLPPHVPTPDSMLQAAKATNSDYVPAVPAIMETWARNPEYVKWLATRAGLVYGGGPLNKDTGDHLMSQGVPVVNLYGTTEGGVIGVTMPAEIPSDWEYFRLSRQLGVKMVPHGNNTFELVIVSNEYSHPSVINTHVDGIDAWSTSDLLVEHPTKPGYWKIFGRSDDQIMHSTGEKTNPGPLESMLNKDPHVFASVMFGRGRFQAGIAVDPKSEFKVDPSDQNKLAEFRNMIWPTIEKMNEFAPQHSRIFKEMILVAKPSKPFQYTAKGTVRRGVTLEDYKDEIDALYNAVEESAQSNIPPPARWDIGSATDFVRAVLGKVMVHAVQDGDDIFQHGCDSLQATWIRNTLSRALHESAKVDTRKITSNFVYDHPTIGSLASAVSALGLGTSKDEGSSNISLSARTDAMRAMVARYSGDFPAHQAGSGRPKASEDVVLVTGTTGSLGCHLLSRLASDPEVGRVYAFNRASRDLKAVGERQRLALIDRGLDAGVLESKKVVVLEGDLTAVNFGLAETTYKELHQSVTHIIHNAWRVDFAIGLSSFEPQVKAVRCLINFALSSPLPEPPRLCFTSSMSVFSNLPCSEVGPEHPIESELAVGMGYAESKWVSEQILYKAAEKSSLKTMVIRVGQICGGMDGAWNAHEWFPSMVQSAAKLGCFPDDNRGVDWIPLELTAAAVIDFRKATNSTNTVHLVHPRPVSWHVLAAVVAAELSVPLVSYDEWLGKLEQTASSISDSVHEKGLRAESERDTVRSLRALQLLDLFKGMAKSASDTSARLALGMAELAVTRAVAASPTLADPDARQLGAEDVKRWLGYWRKVGLFSGSSVP
ncbi:putative NRPS-like protein biosynthetic cluster [Taiwanofungus camphoratus]|nr:putative NRPS-like protein biosynthetic cluster [Antrodia cinnamomea]